MFSRQSSVRNTTSRSGSRWSSATLPRTCERLCPEGSLEGSPTPRRRKRRLQRKRHLRLRRRPTLTSSAARPPRPTRSDPQTAAMSRRSRWPRHRRPTRARARASWLSLGPRNGPVGGCATRPFTGFARTRRRSARRGARRARTSSSPSYTPPTAASPRASSGSRLRRPTRRRTRLARRCSRAWRRTTRRGSRRTWRGGEGRSSRRWRRSSARGMPPTAIGA
mmetsp:Transcript_17380/g.55580  ORF Transcript_17380/g.55580 Transcript_17380/m.55580 type:complete len:222 (-) Transcript_17380:68-733(-)